MTRRASAVVALCSALLMTVVAAPAGHAASTRLAAPDDLVLITQTPTVAQGGSFEARVSVTAPEDARVELVLHGRVRSRTELAASMAGTGLRGQIYNVTTTVASLPVAADGTRTVTLFLNPAVPGNVGLTTAGVYPLAIKLQDGAGTELSSLITHVLVRPDTADESPPLAVAVVARVDALPALQPDGTTRLSDRVVRSSSDLATAIASNSDVPVTLAFRPETLDALAQRGDPASIAALTQLRTAAAGRSILQLPYVDVSPDALVAAELTRELAEQLDRGRSSLTTTLGVSPASKTWFAGPDLDVPGLRALRERGIRHVVVPPGQLEPLRRGVLSLSLAQPFVISSDKAPLVDALALDPVVTSRINTETSPGIEVSQLLAELAVLWFEQPGIARAVVVPVDQRTRPGVVQGLLTGLGAGGLFRAGGLDDVFDTASPLRQPGGDRVDRMLRPGDPITLNGRLAGELTAARTLVGSFPGLIGEDDPRNVAATVHLLLATSSELTTSLRRSHVNAARAAVLAVTGAITAPQQESITLTARKGTVPIALQNDSGLPVTVTVHLRGSKVEFPNGDTLSVTLTDPTTRLNIPVKARTSGTFRLQVLVTSPDGALSLARVDYSVKSTAVSGAGLILSIGAALFLLVWWARHWHRTRRARKLVTGTGLAEAPH